MRQQIVLPWRDAGCSYRSHHFNWLYDYYSKEFDVIVADNNGEFNRSAARNVGVDLTTCKVAVVIDADNYIPYEQIHVAVTAAERQDRLVKPFMSFGYLTEQSTALFYKSQEDSSFTFTPEYLQAPTQNFKGGAYVMKKDLWNRLGGMDEGFIGWGGEDDAFHLNCANNGIRTRYVDGYDYHLFHPQARVASEYNYNKLVKEYVRGNLLHRLGNY